MQKPIVHVWCICLLILGLTACGGGGSGDGDRPATPANAAPVANAGGAQSVTIGGAVTLDGSTSFDADGDRLTYAWTLTTRPSASAATLSSSTAAKPVFTADVAGSYVASLIVHDGKVSSAPSSVSVTATAAAHALSYAIFPPQALTNLQARASRDAAALSSVTAIFNEARRASARPPAPKAVLDIEGNLASQDAQIVNEDILALNAFGLDYRLNANQTSLSQANAYLLAWAQVYQPMGNPITEEYFYKFVGGYELVRGDLPATTQNIVNSFLRRLFESGKSFLAAGVGFIPHGNWDTRHLGLVTAIAYTLNDAAMIGYCQSKFSEEITYNIFPGGTLVEVFPQAVNYPQLAQRLNEVVLLGSTLDFLQRDAMQYDVASKDGLLAAAWTAHYHGLDWLALAAGKGQTLRDGLNFTIPYATGQITHAEFVNSLVTFDRVNNRGGLFDPVQAQRLLTRAAALDSRYSQYAKPALLSPFERVLYYSISTAP